MNKKLELPSFVCAFVYSCSECFHWHYTHTHCLVETKEQCSSMIVTYLETVLKDSPH